MGAWASFINEYDKKRLRNEIGGSLVKMWLTGAISYADKFGKLNTDIYCICSN
jgi:hypothetical protein